jgi:hypothetical protein
MVIWTVGLINRALGDPDVPYAGSLNFGLLALDLVQIALLISTPIYERTREDWAERQLVSDRMWPAPRWWMATVALAGGLIITLLSLTGMSSQHVPGCQSQGTQCETHAEGTPVHYLSAIPVDAGRMAYPVFNAGAAAEDLTVWTSLSFTACYLLWLPRQRPTETAKAPIAAPA